MNLNDMKLFAPDDTSRIRPLFWQHHEDEAVLRGEIRAMHENGIGSFIVESRPHPDFLGPLWWTDLDLIIDEARSLGMQVWIFDDKAFPSGFAAGIVRENHPELLKRYLAERHIDTVGPRTGASFLVGPWLGEGESLVRAVVAKRVGADGFDPGTLEDVTGLVSDGILYWDPPAGPWRVFLFIETRLGGEEWTKDYINPIDARAVDAYIEAVYEPHYERYRAEFGKTIAGFFSDEPRFGNAPTYAGIIGRFPMVLPFSASLMDELGAEWGGDFSKRLPALWYEGGEETGSARYAYMNLVSRLFGRDFIARIGDWCRARGVELIGHIVEDNGAHSRLGYGPGHFFRAVSGYGASGLDVVYQIWPGYDSGSFATPFGNLDADFFYWGIAKMASSAAHIDPKKKGTTVCEAFGAYGWQEGLKLMKWLTDHLAVRGVNLIIPHAFSPKFPDPDCPPHFRALGMNPQWKHFGVWSAYANRVCRLLSGGVHVAPVAVVYHAEAEWGGEAMGFEKLVKALSRVQIDCDVLPIDALVDPASAILAEGAVLAEGTLRVNGETYRAVAVPYAQRLPAPFIERLRLFAEAGLPVYFVAGFPESAYGQAGNAGGAGPEDLGANGTGKRPAPPSPAEILKAAGALVVPTPEDLSGAIAKAGFRDLEASDSPPSLRYCHYLKEGRDLWFLTNEDIAATVSTRILLSKPVDVVAYDALADRAYRLDCRITDGKTSFPLELGPYESLFVLSSDEGLARETSLEPLADRGRRAGRIPIEGSWRVFTSTQEEREFKPAPVIEGLESSGLGNVSVPGPLRDFSGTLRYDIDFEYAGDPGLASLALDLGEVFETASVALNGIEAGVRICPPYRFEVAGLLRKGRNSLSVSVTNTLAKRLGNNAFDRCMAQEPSGLIGPVAILF
jgi:hypothetical protein